MHKGESLKTTENHLDMDLEGPGVKEFYFPDSKTSLMRISGQISVRKVILVLLFIKKQKGSSM